MSAHIRSEPVIPNISAGKPGGDGPRPVMPVNDKDLESEALINAEQPVEVRVIGGIEILRQALRAAGAEYSIISHAPESWADQ